MIFYRDLKNYKYQLMDDYRIKIKITPETDIIEPPPPMQPYIKLDTNGNLEICRFYAWDGPSGPAIDTKNFMRGSLVHDALYQLMRQKRISIKNREYADDLLRQICIEDGMSRFRAWYVHKGVRIFSAPFARPANRDEYKIKTAP
jgi:hypothetical protein